MRIAAAILSAIFTALILTACSTTTPAVETTAPRAPETAVSETNGTHTAPRMATLGDRIEVRPGVFITATATTQVVEPPTFSGGHGPPVRTVTVTVAFENRGDAPVADTSVPLGISPVSTLDGASLATSGNGPIESMGPVHPGQTGHLVYTVEGSAYTGEPIQFSIPMPALLGETATGPFGPPAAYYTGTPTSK